MLGRLGFYMLMVACVSWNIFNMFHYTGSVYRTEGYLGAVPYVLLCLFGSSWGVFAMAWRYKRDKKRKCQSCEK